MPIGLTHPQWRAMDLYARFEQVIAWLLTLVITLVIVTAGCRLSVDVVRTVVFRAMDPLDHEVFPRVFGGIMTLLIAMEFNHSIIHASGRVRGVVKVRTVLLVAVLALSRKFIVLDLKTLPSASVFGLAAAILSLGTVYWLLRESDERAAVLRHPAEPHE
jgi:uncharacterized membrane protein (DUF373 family)